MRNGKSVNNGLNGGSVSGISVSGLAQASKDFVNGKDEGSSRLAPNFALGSGVPEPEVRIRRRRLTREYKIQVLKDLDKLKGKPGAVGEFLRKEGLYSATVAYWKKQRNEGTLGKTRGRKPKSAELIEVEKLQKENRKLKEKIGQYVLVIEAQKKISEILGIRQDNVPPMPEEDQDE